MSIKSISERKKQCESYAMKRSEECPSTEDILAVMEQPWGKHQDGAVIFGHLLNCRECLESLRFTCEAVEEEQERKRWQAMWRQFHAKAARRICSGENIPCEERIDAIAAEATSALIIQAAVSNSDVHFWRATMAFPDVDQPDSPLTIRVEDAEGKPLPRGTFRIFGLEIPIANGTGYMTRDQLVRSHHKGGASFVWQDGALVPGTPILNA